MISRNPCSMSSTNITGDTTFKQTFKHYEEGYYKGNVGRYPQYNVTPSQKKYPQLIKEKPPTLDLTTNKATYPFWPSNVAKA